MRKRIARTCLACIAGALLACTLAAHGALADETPAATPPAASPADASPEDASLTFEAQIAPILEARCIKCHGGEKTEAGLDLRRKSTMLQGGDSGASLVEGKPEVSLLWQKIEAAEMPPPEEGALDAVQRDLLRRWIAAGAPLAGPEAPLEDTESVSRLTDEDRQFWAFQPPVTPALPAVKAADRVRTPIDALVLAKLEEHGLSYNPDADRLVLLRRLTFDLLGLPPTPEQIDEFLTDDRSDAYERLVDRLLDSPRYGERWGRHWLDIAGYADSDGYLAADRLRPEAWRYRDYVIRALNRDLPYDQFVREQLAGDELSNWRQADELTPEMVEQLAATGFLRTASDPTYPGYTEMNEIHQVLSDTIQIVGSAFLGLTMQCARCHSHKFDPISQRDYYAFQSVLLASMDPARWQPSEVRGIPLATEAQQARIQEQNQRADERLTYLNGSLASLTSRYRKKALVEKLPATGQPPDAATWDMLLAALAVTPDHRNPEQKQLVAQWAGDTPLAEADLVARFADFKQESDQIKAAIAAESALKRQVPLVRGITDMDDKPAQGHVLRRGEYNKPGAAVEPGVPEVLATVGFQFQPQSGYKTSGRRAAFARWLTDPTNPLLARTHVNRMWAHHFGRPLVATPANFGRSGAKPSHPELLDWLATEFTRQGWSQKAMHRLMVLSTVYRQTSTADAAKAAIDPENRWLWSWQPRRHEGEVLRDAVLAVTGKLNLEMFGPPSPVAPQADGSVVTNDDDAGNRRSIYLIVRRSQHLTMLDMFDTPLMEINCPERSESIVPMQALAMLHAPFAERSAAALAERVLQTAPADLDARLNYAYRLLVAREPSASERKAMAAFLEEFARDALQEKYDTADEAQREAARREGWTQLALVLLNGDEFLFVH